MFRRRKLIAYDKDKAMKDQSTDKYFLAAIVRSAQDSIITVDFDLKITTWNKGAERIYGYPAKEVIGKQLTKITLPVDLHLLTEGVIAVRDGKRVKLFDNVRVKKDGEEIWVEIGLSPVKDSKGKVIGVSTQTRDVTKRKKAEEALIRHDELLQKLLNLQEAERARMASEMQDQIGQEVTSLRFLLKSTTSKAEVPGVKNNLEEMEHIIGNVDRDLDLLSWELRPPELEPHSSLTASMNKYAKHWTNHSGLKIAHIEAINGKPFNFAVSTNLYRIMQEALDNVQKHADATGAEVSLTRRKDAAVLVICDNGKGFNPKRVPKNRGIGLNGMRERADLIGAKFEIESSRGKGTTIYITVPAAAAA